MNKKLRTLTCILLPLLLTIADADAKGGFNSSRSGFSRSPSPAKSSSFGMFSSKPAPDAPKLVTAAPAKPAPQPSALSADLTKSRQQTDALNAWDKKHAMKVAAGAAVGGTGLAAATAHDSSTGSVYRDYQTHQTTPSPTPHTAYTPAPTTPPTVIVNNGGGGTLNNMVNGYLIGSLLSGHHDERPASSPSYSNTTSTTDPFASGNTVRKDSDNGLSLFWIAFWIMMATVIGVMVYRYFQSRRNPQSKADDFQPRKAKYTLD